MNIKQILADHVLWLNNKGGTRADLSGANLSGANLRGANLREADLREANLREANLREANLSSADLRGANLCWANLSGADLIGANLSGADLIGANLSGADLIGANLREANLSGANLSKSVGVDYAQCSWTGHGQCGRQLNAIRIENTITLFCGCFKGTPNDLEQYIATSEEKYKTSRTRAMKFILECFTQQ